MQPDSRWHLRTLSEAELDALYENHIEKDFPSPERPSLAAMHRHLRENLQNILVMTDGTSDAAYAVCAEANGIVLVTLLAVMPTMRGGGKGTTLLALLRKAFAGKRAILLEVEDPVDAADAEEHAIRTRRIAFYERSGYALLPGIRHTSFGVRLLLMSLPLGDTAEGIAQSAVEDIRAIYKKVLPEHLRPAVITEEA